MKSANNQPPPNPAPPPRAADLPHPITFHTTSRERSAILKALKRLDPNRRTALCKSLGIPPNPSPKQPRV